MGVPSSDWEIVEEDKVIKVVEVVQLLDLEKMEAEGRPSSDRFQAEGQTVDYTACPNVEVETDLDVASPERILVNILPDFDIFHVMRQCLSC